MFTTSRTKTLAYGLFTAGCLLATGCDLGDQAPAGDTEQALLRFGDALHSDSPLDRIGAQFNVLEPTDLGLDGRPMSAEDASQLVAGLHGLGFSLDEISADELDAWQPLADAAMQQGVPLILENIDDADKLAKLIGVGIEADLAMVTSIGPNQYHVRVYGDHGFDEARLEGLDGVIANLPEPEQDIALGVEEITAELRSAPSRVVINAVPQNGYRYYDFDMTEGSFDLSDTQTASLSLDFEAELVLDEARGKKVVFIRPIGSGQHPGSLDDDGSSKRGYYQESQEITLTPSNTSDLALYKHEPATPNGSSSYTSTTGWTIGVSGTDPVLSYSASDQVTTTQSDFSMVNNTSNQVASWKLGMSTSWGNMFYHPAFSKCKIHGLPALSKSNLKPEFEVMYRADTSFSGNIDFSIQKISVFRRLWRGGDIFTCKKNTEWWTLTRGRTIRIHFGSI